MYTTRNAHLVVWILVSVLACVGCDGGDSTEEGDGWNAQRDGADGAPQTDTATSDDTTDTATRNDDTGIPTCDAVLVRCCDRTGEFVSNADCTHDGLRCPSGTRSAYCTPDTGDTGMDVPETTDTVTCSADAIPKLCCSEQTGGFVSQATCTQEGWTCAPHTEYRNRCDSEVGTVDSRRCPPNEVSCCTEGGSFATYPTCTASSEWECPADTTLVTGDCPAGDAGG